MLEKELTKLGFSEDEAKIYLICLEVGSVSADALSKKAGIDRVHVYLTLDLLVNKGLISSHENNGISYFGAENPERILDYYTQKQFGIKEKINVFNSIAPQLVSLLSHSGEKPRVRFFEGSEGLRAVRLDFLDTMNSGEIIYTFLPYDEFYGSMLSEGVKEASKKRNEKGIKMKIIYTSKKGRRLEYEKKEKERLKEFKFVEYEDYPFKGGLNIYGTKIFMVDYLAKTSGLVIENKTLADMLVFLFKIAWNQK